VALGVHGVKITISNIDQIVSRHLQFARIYRKDGRCALAEGRIDLAKQALRKVRGLPRNDHLRSLVKKEAFNLRQDILAGCERRKDR
jgi:hypothetical protein